jgi:hypothetical protein
MNTMTCVLFRVAQGEFRWFLALSIFWALYNMIPPSLFIFYLFKSDGIFEDYCSFCFITSFILGIGGIVCTWLVPDDYNLGQVKLPQLHVQPLSQRCLCNRGQRLATTPIIVLRVPTVRWTGSCQELDGQQAVMRQTVGWVSPWLLLAAVYHTLLSRKEQTAAWPSNLAAAVLRDPQRVKTCKHGNQRPNLLGVAAACAAGAERVDAVL